MPRTNIDYSKTIIYKICCKDINITDIYVGHTTDMRKRKYKHKYCCYNENDKNHNLKVYQFIRENGGFDDWDMIEVERYNAIDSYDAIKRERYWIEELKAGLNCNIPTRKKKEYYENNKEYFIKNHIEYYECNKERIKEYEKEYRENNRKIINEKLKKYYIDNKEYYSEKRKEKITCECGCFIRKGDLARHQKSKKHIELIQHILNKNSHITDSSSNNT